MTKSELIAKISEGTAFSKKDTETFLNSFMSTVKDALISGKSVKLVGFMNFEVRNTAERKGRNPQTKEEITIPASKKVAVKIGSDLKNAIKNS